jgi:cysteine-rich repeat protein
MNTLRRHFDRLDAWLVATSIVASLVIALSHCNDNAVCGNGIVESGETCDKGAMNGVENSGCSATWQVAALDVAKINIFVTRLKDEAMGYPSAGCSDLGASKQHVVLAGPDPMDMTIDCNMSSYILNDVTPGDYTATVTLLDGSGMPLTNPVSSMPGTAVKGQMINLMVNFALKDFIKQDYTGTLYFKPEWGVASTSCTMASPVVTGYGVTLRNKAGQLVSGMSTGNRALDGTSGPCFVPSANGTPEAVANLTWGHYSLSFTGYAGGELAYCKTFDVFSGPGTADVMTYDLVVPTYDSDGGACP